MSLPFRAHFRLSSALLLIGVFASGLAMFLRPAEGTLRRTNRELDLAIVGDGYIQICCSATGELRYTRKGRFYITPNRVLALAPHDDGLFLEPAICIPSDCTRVRIDPTGMVFVLEYGTEPESAVGMIQLATFANPATLAARADGTLSQTTEPPVTHEPGDGGTGLVQQYWLEARPSPAETLTQHGPLLSLLFFSGVLLISWFIAHRRVARRARRASAEQVRL